MKTVQNWDVNGSGELSEAAVRARLNHPERYRVSHHRYPPGTSFPGRAMAGTVYIIQGTCRYMFGDEEFLLHSGQCCELPEGGFTFKVVGDEPVEEVKVWLLPEAVWPS